MESLSSSICVHEENILCCPLAPSYVQVDWLLTAEKRVDDNKYMPFFLFTAKANSLMKKTILAQVGFIVLTRRKKGQALFLVSVYVYLFFTEQIMLWEKKTIAPLWILDLIREHCDDHGEIMFFSV